MARHAKARSRDSAQSGTGPEAGAVEFYSGQARNWQVEEFARRLADRMALRGMSGSDLARAVWGESPPDHRGYKGAKGRDRISAYLNAKSMPGTKTLGLLADALDCKPWDLVPDRGAPGTPSAAGVHLSMVSSSPSLVQLDLQMVMPLSAALEILAVLERRGVAGEGQEKGEKDDDAGKTSG